MNSLEKIYGFHVINPQNFSELIRVSKVADFRKISDTIPLQEYLKMDLTETEKKELRFAPKTEVIKFKDPAGENFTGFRNSLKDGVLIFALLPDNLLPICAEFRHGCERVMLNLPAGLIESDDANPGARAKKEFEEEIGITLKELISLNSGGVPIDARILTRKNFFFLGVPAEPIEVKEQKLHEAEFVARFLVRLPDWLEFMEMGTVDGCSVSGTLLALRKLEKIKTSGL